MRNEHVNDAMRGIVNGIGNFEPEPIELECDFCTHWQSYTSEADRAEDRRDNWYEGQNGDVYCSKGCRAEAYDPGVYDPNE